MNQRTIERGKSAAARQAGFILISPFWIYGIPGLSFRNKSGHERGQRKIGGNAELH